MTTAAARGTVADQVPQRSAAAEPGARRVSFQVEPSGYRHWRLTVEGPVATLAMDVDEHGGLDEGYELKLNSYHLGVDIELYAPGPRLRVQHPEVRTVGLPSPKGKDFFAGANIRMLATP